MKRQATTAGVLAAYLFIGSGIATLYLVSRGLERNAKKRP